MCSNSKQRITSGQITKSHLNLISISSQLTYELDILKRVNRIKLNKLSLERVLISGGYPQHNSGGNYHNKKVELFNLINKTSCYLPDMPVQRGYHTSVGGVICGGVEDTKMLSREVALTLPAGRGQYQPKEKRSGHVSWNVHPGVSFMLLGSYDSSNRRTTNVVYRNGTTDTGFTLPYDVQ